MTKLKQKASKTFKAPETKENCLLRCNSRQNARIINKNKKRKDNYTICYWYPYGLFNSTGFLVTKKAAHSGQPLYY